MHDCLLCKNRSVLFHRDSQRAYYQCDHCRGIFVSPEDLPDGNKEKQRYETHNNDVEDPGYQNFVKPIVDYITQNCDPLKAIGLDYGAGPGPVAAKLLSDKGFEIKLYDPFFEDNKKALQQSYDFIICSEVMEHFHRPARDFKRLYSLLKPGGHLVCMTAIYHEDIDFGTWFYKNDITHVFFYCVETLEYLKNQFGFSDLEVDGRLIVLGR